MNIPSFSLENHVLVVGDIMLDRYWHGITERISPEAPVPIVKIDQQQDRPGGAANVALNIQCLNTSIALLGLIGQDEAGMQLENLLSSSISTHLLKELPKTIVKLRVLSRHQQLLRLDFEEYYSPNDDNLLKSYEKLLKDIKVVVLSDYNKGCLQNSQALIQLAKKYNIPVLVDPKGKNFTKYQGATIITPNRSEFEAIVGACPDDNVLIEKGQALKEKLDLQALLITLSERGMLLLEEKPHFLPAQTKDVYDVTGAGDTVIAVLAASMAAGASIEQSCFWANYAAGIVVTKLGASQVTIEELEQYHTAYPKILDLNDLLKVLQQVRKHKEKIVMTNGCFDILHPGHIQYLEKAKALGDRLIIAVNDDNSVKRLKGETRPINDLQARMQVLAGLQAIDWLVSFSEDTPLNIIKAIAPDILVKGGDYQVENIVGYDFVTSYGGTVLTLPYINGYSTTSIIQKAQQ